MKIQSLFELDGFHGSYWFEEKVKKLMRVSEAIKQGKVRQSVIDEILTMPVVEAQKAFAERMPCMEDTMIRFETYQNAYGNGKGGKHIGTVFAENSKISQIYDVHMEEFIADCQKHKIQFPIHLVNDSFAKWYAEKHGDIITNTAGMPDSWKLRHTAFIPDLNEAQQMELTGEFVQKFSAPKTDIHVMASLQQPSFSAFEDSDWVRCLKSAAPQRITSGKATKMITGTQDDFLGGMSFKLINVNKHGYNNPAQKTVENEVGIVYGMIDRDLACTSEASIIKDSLVSLKYAKQQHETTIDLAIERLEKEGIDGSL